MSVHDKKLDRNSVKISQKSQTMGPRVNYETIESNRIPYEDECHASKVPHIKMRKGHFPPDQEFITTAPTREFSPRKPDVVYQIQIKAPTEMDNLDETEEAVWNGPSSNELLPKGNEMHLALDKEIQEDNNSSHTENSQVWGVNIRQVKAELQMLENPEAFPDALAVTDSDAHGPNSSDKVNCKSNRGI